MSDFTIEKVFVYPFKKAESDLLGFARIQIEGGLFLSEMRIYKDFKDPNNIFIAFPTRKDNNGDAKKVVYPVIDAARIKITEAIHKEYLIKRMEDE